MQKFFSLALGGALGTILRYLVSGAVHKYISNIFPWGTLVVNLLGSLVIGILWELSSQEIISPPMKIFIFIGILGGFTTFSTYCLENFNLLRDGELPWALMNIFLSNFLGIGLVFVGAALSRYVLGIFK